MKVEAAGAYELVERALEAQRCVVLDGGIATELPHRHGQDHERLWGIEALASAPDDVLDVHRRYANAGVDVLTTNTWTLATVAEGDGAIAREFGSPGALDGGRPPRRRVARQAIAEAGRDGECAVAFSLNGDLGGAETVSLLSRALADDAPDLILLETLSVLQPSLFDVVEALVATSVPVWLSFRRCRHGLCGVYGQHWGGPEGDAFGRAARRFEDMGVAALLVNCIPPDHVDGMVVLPARLHRPAARRLPQPRLLHERRAGASSPRSAGRSMPRWRCAGAPRARRSSAAAAARGPEHIAAAREALAGRCRAASAHESRPRDATGAGRRARRAPPEWTDRARPSPVPARVPEAHQATRRLRRRSPAPT